MDGNDLVVSAAMDRVDGVGHIFYAVQLRLDLL